MSKTIIAILLAASVSAVLLLGFAVVEASPPQQQEATIFEVPRDSVVGFQVSDARGQTVLVTRTVSSPIWRIRQPNDSPANQRGVAETLDLLFKPVRTVNDPTEIAGIGPVMPTELSILLTASDGGLYGLWIGKQNVDKTAYYARKMATEPATRIFVIPNSMVEQLSKFVATPPIAPMPTPTSPSPTPVPPTPTVTMTPTPMPTATRTPTATRSPTVTATAVPSTLPPPTATPTLPPPTPTPTLSPPTATPTPPPPTAAPTVAPTPTWFELAADVIKQNPLLFAGGSGGCVLSGLVFVGVILLLLRRRKPQPPRPAAPPLPGGPYLESVTLPSVQFNLTKDVVTVGRAKDCDVQITEKLQGAETVSRHHARLEKRKDRWLVIDGDLNGKPSTNGVFVKDSPTRDKSSRTRENYLEDGYEIGFGQVVFRFHLQRTPPNTAQGGSR